MNRVDSGNGDNRLTHDEKTNEAKTFSLKEAIRQMHYDDVVLSASSDMSQDRFAHLSQRGES